MFKEQLVDYYIPIKGETEKRLFLNKCRLLRCTCKDFYASPYSPVYVFLNKTATGYRWNHQTWNYSDSKPLYLARFLCIEGFEKVQRVPRTKIKAVIKDRGTKGKWLFLNGKFAVGITPEYIKINYMEVDDSRTKRYVNKFFKDNVYPIMVKKKFNYNEIFINSIDYATLFTTTRINL